MGSRERTEVEPARIQTGALALVVGPSGAGKDALMNAARAALGDTGRFFFARRVVTRAGHDGSEDHDVMDDGTFARALSNGTFLLSWCAHGIRYAIPATAADALRASRVVVANVSRTCIAEAENLVERVAVLHVTAPANVLARRIAARGRESEAEIAARLARQVPLVATRAPVFEIVNDGRLEAAAQRFSEILKSLAEGQEGNGR
jgi:phosphonate metabolism protein PhnN/1,5-bisphosphokinase (PRPP-forming)